MRYTLFGRTGLRVSELCLGTMTFGESWGWGAPKDTCRRVLDLFAEAGGTFVDTANNYTGGQAETIVGELLEGRREQFVVASKYTLQTRPGDQNAVGNQRKNLVQSLETTLRRLRSDYVDVYFVHARDTFTPVEEIVRALDDQVRLGKVLYVAVSDWPAWEIARATTIAELRGWTPFAGVELPYSLVERTPERELLPMAQALDLAVAAFSPLASGLLTGKYLPDAEGGPAGNGRIAESAGRRLDARTERIVREVVAVAGELEATPSQVALAWLRSRPGVVIPIVGVTSEEQLRDNLGCLDVHPTPEHLRRLDEASAIDLGFPYEFLRREVIKKLVYGDAYDRVDDRRLSGGRALADDWGETRFPPRPPFFSRSPR
jgi:aryl-alcohol dehydrogenase-like predicted oxidoreductase